MTDDDVRQWLIDYLDVSRETLDRIDQFVHLLVEENGRQNLVSSGTLPQIWTRHILDSAQLIRFAPDAQSWLDLGSGAGFPGLIVALLQRSATVTMIESRPLRVDFLRRAADRLALPATTRVICTRVETFPSEPFEAISARAFAPLDRLLALAHRFAAPATRWVLPKGRSAKTELEQAESSWQGRFRVEPSLTDAEAGIIVATGVRPRGKDKKTR